MTKKYCMKKIAVFITIIFLLNSCSKNKNISFDEELIKRMSIEDFGLPSQYTTLILFAKCENSKVVETNIQQLRAIYKKDYNNMKFKDYLSQVLNQDLEINGLKKTECFLLDNEIAELYNNNSFENFLLKFCEKSGSESYILKKNISEEKRRAFFYYCFINNYMPMFDDYIGYYDLHKSSTLY